MVAEKGCLNNQIFDYLNTLKKPWKFLAPMVSNSEEAYRILSRKYGADLCYTEMVNCKIFNQGDCNPRKNFWYSTSESDRPLVIQICGNDPEVMLETCFKIQKYCDAIDINFGCPQEIARKGHYGSYLQDEWDLIERIVRLLSTSINVPLFCKIRIFDSIERTVEYAKMIEKAGCSLLVVHGRLREQRGAKTGLASWNHIKAVKQALSIPVVANGNMIYHQNIHECYESTGCDGVMIAEPHLYNPTIFVSSENKSINVLRDYLMIVKENPKTAERIHIKSHSFKILKLFLTNHPEFNVTLDGCKTVEEYLLFLDNVKTLVDKGNIPLESLKMVPYIRKTIELIK